VVIQTRTDQIQSQVHTLTRTMNEIEPCIGSSETRELPSQSCEKQLFKSFLPLKFYKNQSINPLKKANSTHLCRQIWEYQNALYEMVVEISGENPHLFLSSSHECCSQKVVR